MGSVGICSCSDPIEVNTSLSIVPLSLTLLLLTTMLYLPRSFGYSQKYAVLVPAAALGVGGMLVYWLRSRHKIKTIEMSDGWWGSGERPVKGKEDESIRPFKIETSDKEIEVLVAGM